MNACFIHRLSTLMLHVDVSSADHISVLHLPLLYLIWRTGPRSE